MQDLGSGTFTLSKKQIQVDVEATAVLKSNSSDYIPLDPVKHAFPASICSNDVWISKSHDFHISFHVSLGQPRSRQAGAVWHLGRVLEEAEVWQGSNTNCPTRRLMSAIALVTATPETVSPRLCRAKRARPRPWPKPLLHPSPDRWHPVSRSSQYLGCEATSWHSYPFLIFCSHISQLLFPASAASETTESDRQRLSRI